MIKDNLRDIFWDVNPDRVDPRAYPRYTIERVLEHGDEDDVAWLRRVFTTEQIQEVVRTSRRLDARSASFWALVFQVPSQEVAALQR